MRDPETDRLLTEVRRAVAAARAGGVTVHACLFDAAVAAVDQEVHAWPSAAARKIAAAASTAAAPAGPAPATGRAKAVADAIGPTMLLGLQDAELFDEPGQERIRDWIKWISETVAALPAMLPAPTDQTATDEEQVDRLAQWLWDNCAEDERSGLLADDPRRIAAVALRWPELRRLAGEAQQDETPDGTAAALLATPCDACDHTLKWHRNDVGCTAPRCVCGRWQDPAAVARPGQPETD
jgi:hypothetical protein